MSNRLVLKSLIVINILLLLVGVGRIFYVHYEKEQSRLAQDRYSAQRIAKTGMMTENQFMDSQRIERATMKSGSISDSDLNTVIAMVQPDLTTLTDPTKSKVVFALSCLRYLRRDEVSPAQKQRIRDVCRAVLASNTLGNTDKIIAAQIVYRLGNISDAYAFLQVAKNSSEPSDRDIAERLLTGKMRW